MGTFLQAGATRRETQTEDPRSVIELMIPTTQVEEVINSITRRSKTSYAVGRYDRT